MLLLRDGSDIFVSGRYRFAVSMARRVGSGTDRCACLFEHTRRLLHQVPQVMWAVAFGILDACTAAMAPVRGLLALISEIEGVYESKAAEGEHAIRTECARLRAWSMLIQQKDALCVRDAALLDERLTYLASVLVGNWLAILLDESVDAIFARGSNIIATVHLHDLQGKFKDFSIQVRQMGDDTDDGLDELLARMRLIEQELESSADDVLELQALKSLNLMVSLKLTELVEEIGKVCVIFPGFHKLCMDLSKIQQRLALDQ